MTLGEVVKKILNNTLLIGIGSFTKKMGELYTDGTINEILIEKQKFFSDENYEKGLEAIKNIMIYSPPLEAIGYTMMAFGIANLIKMYWKK